MSAPSTKVVCAHGISRYGTQLVSDHDIVKFTGFDTYCRLRKAQPDLYIEYVECWTTPKHPIHIEALTFEVDPEQVKAQLVGAIAANIHTPLTQQLAAPPSNKPLQFEVSSTGIFFWVVWLFIIVLSIIGYLAYAGHIQYIFSHSSVGITSMI